MPLTIVVHLFLKYEGKLSVIHANW